MRPPALLALAVLAFGCGAGGYHVANSFEQQQATSRPAGYPPSAAPVVSSGYGSVQTAGDVAVAVAETVSAVGKNAATGTGPAVFSEKIRGQVVLTQAAGADVLPYVGVNVLRDGKVIGRTKADVAGKFSFGNLSRGPHEVVLDSPAYEGGTLVTVGFGTAEVIVVARAAR